MQAYVNTKLVESRSRTGKYLILGGFLLWLLSLSIAITLTPETIGLIPLSYLFMFLGYILFQGGMHWYTAFGRSPRPDELLAKALKGLDNKTRLYSYLWPVEQLLLTPWALYVVEMRWLVGKIRVKGDRWQRPRNLLEWFTALWELGRLGNPSQDAQRSVEATRKLLTQVGEGESDPLQSVPIEPLVVFVSPRVQLTVEEPTIPVLLAKDLKDYLKKQSSRPKLPEEQYKLLTQVLKGEEQQQ